YYFPGALDLKKIEGALPLFFGEHNFKAFTAANSGRENFVRTLDLITVNREGDYVYFDFWGRGFLYKMVRSISGSLIDLGRGYFGKDVIEKALETGDRSVLSLTAPSKGLSLIKIYYNDEYELDKEKSLR
ncbi:MAG: tRNA pseudouridine(38-40) synthase TruA, partial [Clostridia bacterium]